ncbi:hypothetical protein ACNKHW_27460 [Shigella flexneri]
MTLAMEIIDYPLMNSISKALGYAHYLDDPSFQLFPDIGNLWRGQRRPDGVAGRNRHIVAVHVKDTKPGVSKTSDWEGVVDVERSSKRSNGVATAGRPD